MDTQLVAHRGGAGVAPENTLGAFRAANDRFDGVWVEMDGRLTADGELVLLHDHVLERTTSCHGVVAERTARELAGCDAAVRWPQWGAEPLPTARDTLLEGRDAGWRILFEVKNIPGDPDFDPSGDRQAEALVALLHETGFPLERFAAISFWPPTLDRLKALLPELRVGFISAALLPDEGRGLAALDNVRLAAERGYEITAPQHTSPDLPDAIDAAREHGLLVNVWTVNERDDIGRMLELGVDLLTTDFPDRVRAGAEQDD
jgi:glycerophosphoryl diester phosphodiesterase